MWWEQRLLWNLYNPCNSYATLTKRNSLYFFENTKPPTCFYAGSLTVSVRGSRFTRLNLNKSLHVKSRVDVMMIQPNNSSKKRHNLDYWSEFGYCSFQNNASWHTSLLNPWSGYIFATRPDRFHTCTCQLRQLMVRSNHPGCQIFARDLTKGLHFC